VVDNLDVSNLDFVKNCNMHRAGCQGTLSVKKFNLAAFHFNTVKEL